MAGTGGGVFMTSLLQLSTQPVSFGEARSLHTSSRGTMHSVRLYLNLAAGTSGLVHALSRRTSSGPPERAAQ